MMDKETLEKLIQEATPPLTIEMVMKSIKKQSQKEINAMKPTKQSNDWNVPVNCLI
ncbi:hypothetical protein KCU_11363 [Pasteurella multocida subsp. multocida str. P52VAC]|nr:hypothetical protein KCU_11363 [Pasteurella multocida subsp. multocida str. P52VAC]